MPLGVELDMEVRLEEGRDGGGNGDPLAKGGLVHRRLAKALGLRAVKERGEHEQQGRIAGEEEERLAGELAFRGGDGGEAVSNTS